MENRSAFSQNLPTLLWILAAGVLIVTVGTLSAPYASGISLTGAIMLDRIVEIGSFFFAVLGGLAVIEVYFYQILFREPRPGAALALVRGLQVLIGVFVATTIVAFFDLTDLIRLGSGPLADAIRLPLQSFSSGGGILIIAAMLAIFAVVHACSGPRNSRNGLAYLLVMPALLGVLFLIIYPFLFEIKLAFSNASLGTQATKNASYGLEYGWANIVTLFTGKVAQDARFFDVFGRTVLWTAINVTFHVVGGMAIALLLNRPMKLQGLYRTLLVIPWAIPTTIAAMALRNEFDNRYGLFNILLTDLHDWLAALSLGFTGWAGLFGNAFGWLAVNVGPVSWKQDPVWAFVSVLISNIWLGIPFMSVIILGGLQSISQEYYEAAEIDGASKWQQFRHITLPMLRPVLTPAIVLGVVWTFNKFDIIYLITQGGPQEKTDILVSSMYKAAFQFYRYGFTAMFALVIFVILFIFTLIYLRISGGLQSATE